MVITRSSCDHEIIWLYQDHLVLSRSTQGIVEASEIEGKNSNHYTSESPAEDSLTHQSNFRLSYFITLVLLDGILL